MNEASSTPKAMKWRALCVFKVFLTIYPRPAVRGRLNPEDGVQNVNLLFTKSTNYNVIQTSVNVLERRGSLYN